MGERKWVSVGLGGFPVFAGWENIKIKRKKQDGIQRDGKYKEEEWKSENSLCFLLESSHCQLTNLPSFRKVCDSKQEFLADAFRMWFLYQSRNAVRHYVHLMQERMVGLVGKAGICVFSRVLNCVKNSFENN
jgi:hypothetical protein